MRTTSSKVKMPHFNLYDCSRDPIEHLESYCSSMGLQRGINSTMCKSFALTIYRSTRKWFNQLKPGFIALFTPTNSGFLSTFQNCRSVKKQKSYLFTVIQGKQESLKDYIAKLNSKALQIKGCNDDLSLSTMMTA